MKNVTNRPSQATANSVGGKACSSTKGGLLRYIPNTYYNHKVSSFEFEICILQALNTAANTLHQRIFQGRLSRYITSPSERTRPESWPGHYMGKATPVWQLSLSHRCHQIKRTDRAKPQQTPSVEKHAHPPRVVYCAIYLTLTLITKFRVSSLKFAYYKHSILLLIRCTNVFSKGDYPVTKI